MLFPGQDREPGSELASNVPRSWILWLFIGYLATSTKNLRFNFIAEKALIASFTYTRENLKTSYPAIAKATKLWVWGTFIVTGDVQPIYFRLNKSWLCDSANCSR